MAACRPHPSLGTSALISLLLPPAGYCAPVLQMETRVHRRLRAHPAPGPAPRA